MREKAPTEAPLTTLTFIVKGEKVTVPVFVNQTAWVQWFSQGLDLYRTKDRYIDPKFVNYGKYEPQDPYTGLVAYADGVNWNPGDGEGNYIYEDGEWRYIVKNEDFDAGIFYSRIQELSKRIDTLERKLSNRNSRIMELEKSISNLERSL